MTARMFVDCREFPSEKGCTVAICAGLRVLKYEWRRVKRGEPIFFTTKWLSLAAALAATAVGIAHLSGHLLVSIAP